MRVVDADSDRESTSPQPMPELPDVVVYIEALDQRIVGHRLERVRILNPFLLRTAAPPISVVEGKQVKALRRMGKRIVIGFDEDLFLVLHLMIAGRLRWLGPKDKPPGRITLALLEFDNGTVAFTEAGTKRRASLHLVQGEEALRQFDMGGLEVLDADVTTFGRRLKQDNHTLKRALTDPHIFSGIGNAYSDEILHRAKLSPVALSAKLDAEQVARLFDATRAVLGEWTQRLRADAREKFPEKVTAFRPEMAVHGRFGQPCPVCGTPVQRIVHAENETNYCARCQTGGKILADRALSRLLHKSWPRNLDELE
jgi:formamidopyrimidine-DNA glycosylase